jgi:hypothetical protein
MTRLATTTRVGAAVMAALPRLCATFLCANQAWFSAAGQNLPCGPPQSQGALVVPFAVTVPGVGLQVLFEAYTFIRGVGIGPELVDFDIIHPLFIAMIGFR